MLIFYSFLASGDGYHTIALCFRIGISTTSNIIKETCEAIWNSFHAEVLFTPTQNGWRAISNNFEKIWNFPNCIGALDGKHIAVIVSLLYTKCKNDSKANHYYEIIIITIAILQINYFSIFYAKITKRSLV